MPKITLDVTVAAVADSILNVKGGQGSQGPKDSRQGSPWAQG